MKLLTFLVVLAIDSAIGHVALKFDKLEIRNAARAGTGGTNSVNGACGGATTFGKNGINSVTDGDRVCATINYNGGHSAAGNAFRAVFKCDGGLTQAGLESEFPANSLTGAVPLVEGSRPAADIAANGKQLKAPGGQTAAGYTVCVDLPKQGLVNEAENDPKRQCTLSVLDQRQWGGCIDMQLANAVVPTASPTLPPTNPPPFPTAAQGVYKVDTCVSESGGKCCLKGYMGINENGDGMGTLTATSHANFGKITVVASEDETYCNNFEATWKGAQMAWEAEINQAFITSVDANYAGTDQPFLATARDPAATGITLKNVGTTTAVLSDVLLSWYSSIEQGVAEGLIPDPNPVDNTGGGENTGDTGGGDKTDGTVETTPSSGSSKALLGLGAVAVLIVVAVVVNKKRNQIDTSNGVVAPQYYQNQQQNYV